MTNRRFVFISGGNAVLCRCAALAVITAILIMACPTAYADSGATPKSDSSTQATTTLVAPIGPSDMVHIDVVGEPDLSKDYQVDGNGDITMLYVGKLHLGALTPDQAQTTVTNALGQIYVSPQVTLTRSSIGGASIIVTGEVQNQGTKAVRRDAHLNDVVQQATPQADADLSKIQITRGLPGEQHTNMTIDLTAFLTSGDLANNPQLDDGDVIFVPSRSPVTYSVSVVGAVVSPKRFDVQPGSTVYDLIKMAGGLEDDADKTNIYIQPAGTLDRLPFDYNLARTTPEDGKANPVLKDGDKVVVPEESTIPVFSITGAVLKPGQYTLAGKVTLTDAEGLAGGLIQHAKIDQVQITRESATGAQVIKLNTNDPNIPANFLLQPGDNVFIPEGNPSKQSDPLSLLGILIGIGSIFR